MCRRPVAAAGAAGFLGLLLVLALLRPAPGRCEMPAAESRTYYTVTITGIEDRGLKAELESLSDAVRFKERPFPSAFILRRRAAEDGRRFTALLKSYGHFQAGVEVSLDMQAVPPALQFAISPGPAFKLKTVRIEAAPPLPEGLPLPTPGEICLVPGTAYAAKDILAAEALLTAHMGGQGYPFCRVTARDVVADHADRSVSVVFVMDAGPAARFGPTTVTGLKTVSEDLIRRRIPWREGERYNAGLLGTFRERLQALGLFATVRIVPSPDMEAAERLPVEVRVVERRPRHIGFGLGYQTDEGLGGTFKWGHRNLLGQGERLDFDGTVSSYTNSAEATFRKPDFYRADQWLRLNLGFGDDTPEAYTSRSLKALAMVERDLKPGLRTGIGLGWRDARVEQLGQEERYRLLSLPAFGEWDTSDDPLDPMRGHRLGLQVAPFVDTLNDDGNFFKAGLRATRYQVLPFWPKLVVAGRVALGVLTGTDLKNIPADERFYAGGGGSIRGYAYQSVAPYVQGVPVGGRSLAEVSLELRLKLNGRFGLIGFLDGGNAYEGLFQDAGQGFVWGTGLGLRYFTPVGPLRLDVGLPLNRRQDIDKAFQLYISLGQAF